MSEKLTVAELMARNAKDGARRADRPRRRRNLDDGGVSVSELTGSIPVVNDEDLAAAADDGSDSGDSAVQADQVADAHPHRGGHELDDGPAGDATEQDAAEEVSEDATEDLAEGNDDEADEAAVVDGEVVDGEVVDEELHDESLDEQVFDSSATTVIPRVDPSVDDADETSVQDSVQDDEADTPEPLEDHEPAETAVPDADVDSDAAPVAEAEEGDSDKIVEYEDDAISWPALLGQTAIALVVGVVIFFGFTLLWDKLPTALVLVMAGVVTLVCVGVVHALLRHRHTLVLILAFIVGLVITLGPRLIMSV
ncbi:hypothetical protein ACT3SZ_01085 [Corynebacterium sp. AOP40-9SA-29]|uniref:hypothetical protein n=1 Tax=Corynebacterium sp. AOP40-9SA-29 TaxID=3457677 RepID=UPI00403379A5